jgi:hypothetical protein
MVHANLSRCFWCRGELRTVWLLWYNELDGWSPICRSCNDKIWADAALGAAQRLGADVAKVGALTARLAALAENTPPG